MGVEILSLLATGWVMWRVWSGPRSATHSFGFVFRTAVTFTLFAWLWSAVIALLLHLAIRRVEKVDVIGATLRTSAVAVWFAPATMLLSSLSAWSIPAALVLVVNATRLLYSQWQIVYPQEEVAPVLVPQSAGMLGAGELPLAILPRHLGPALAVSFGLQSGLAADLLSHPMLAAALLTMSAAHLTVFAISAGVWTDQRQPSLPRSVFGLILTLLLATGLSVVGVTGGNGWGFGNGSADGPGSILDLFRRGRDGTTDEKLPETATKDKGSGNADLAHKLPPLPPPPPRTTTDLGGSFPGVILWPEVQPVPLLVAPLPAIGGGYATPAHPLSIPFGGEYWMWRSMFFTRPPPNSYFQRGTPAHLSFSTTDRWPLQMEAHQKLEQSVDPTWCGKIQIAIVNADRFPGTVSLELTLVNNQFGAQATESLGQAPVLSTPNLKADPVLAVPETVEFTVPLSGPLRQFNEFQVAFRRARSRADKSARIAIGRFILVPR
jgi:hypothetical protein